MLTIFNTFVHPNAPEQVEKVVRSTFLSEGQMVREFETGLSLQLGLKNPVTVNSGTTALHLALVLCDLRAGDEVILPAQTFIATGLVILMAGARPVFADIDPLTGNIDPADIERRLTKRTRAIMAVHWGGYPCEMDRIQAIARKNGLALVEDAAHALGAKYQGRAIGTLSDYTCFSFQAIKHLTTGDGGALCCLDDSKARKALALRWFGIDRQLAEPSILGERQYDVTAVGYKYHLNDYAAALGVANLNGLTDRLEHRRRLAALYRKELEGVSGIKLLKSEPGIESAYWLFCLRVENREAFIRALKAKGIQASVVHQRIDRNSVFGGLRKDLPGQTAFDASQIHIPLHDNISEADALMIAVSIKQGW